MHFWRKLKGVGCTWPHISRLFTFQEILVGVGKKWTTSRLHNYSEQDPIFLAWNRRKKVVQLLSLWQYCRAAAAAAAARDKHNRKIGLKSGSPLIGIRKKNAILICDHKKTIEFIWFSVSCACGSFGSSSCTCKLLRHSKLLFFSAECFVSVKYYYICFAISFII